MSFSFSEYWVWMLGIPVSLGIIFLVYKRVSYITTLWFSPDQYSRSYPYLTFAFRAAAFILLFLALLGPYWGVEERKVKSLGREVYFLVDVSASMNVQDVGTSRLEKVKAEILRILPDLQGDRVGLMLFTEYPYVQCPLTQDHEAFKLFLDMASTQQFTKTGTEYRSALVTAVRRLEVSRERYPDISQAVVLISDGEDSGDAYASLIDRLRKAGVALFTVGVGTYEGGPVPLNPNGRPAGYIQDPPGTRVISQLQDERLRQLADIFDTKYVSIRDNNSDLSSLIQQIRQVVASPLEVRMLEVESNRYQAFLLVSITLLFITLLLMPIRKE